MFQGRWPNTLSIDQKNRLAVPARLRVDHMDQDGEVEFSIGILQDPCLYLLSAEQRDRLLDRIYRHLGDTKSSRRTKTILLSRFVPVQADSQGRITVPGFLLESAGIKKDVVLIAQESRVEIWGAEALRSLEAELKSAMGDVLEAVFAEEEQERRTLHRVDNPVGEGSKPSG